MRIKERFIYIFIILLIIGMSVLMSIGTKIKKDEFIKSYDFIQSEFDEYSDYFSIIKKTTKKVDLNITDINELYDVETLNGRCVIKDSESNTFIVNSYSSICEDKSSEAYMDLLQALAVTKIMVRNTPNNNFKSIYFISKKGFIISSTSSLARHLNVDESKDNEFENVIFKRPYILNMDKKQFFPNDAFVVTGPYKDFTSKLDTLTFTSKIYRDNRLIGYLNLDVLFSELTKHMCESCNITNDKVNESNLLLNIIVDNHKTDLFYERSFSFWDVSKEIFKDYIFYICFYILLALLVCQQLNFRYQNRRRQYILNSSYRDELTRMLNRRGFNEKSKRMKNSSCRTIAIFDIDDFKKINDTLGHFYGDYVIKEIASVFKNKTREGDLNCRFGGEEFVVVLSTENMNEALVILERIRHGIENNRFYYQGSKSKITISCGAIALMDDDANNHELFAFALDQADRNLYRAKGYGKNNVILEPFKVSN